MKSAPAVVAVVTVALGLAGCASSPGDGPGEAIDDAASLADAVPRDVPRSRYGNPKSYEVFGRHYQVMDSAAGFSQRGTASWYGSKFHGRRTSSGEPYDMYAMTAAHKRLPLPSWVEVTNLANGRRAVVKVNDRGPFAKGRILDLSYAAASKLGVVAMGTAPVEIHVVRPGERVSATTTTTTAAAVAVDEPAPVSPPATEPPASTAVDYYVQVGAFSNRGNAERLAASLRNAVLSVPVRLQAITRDGRSLHRVQLGPLGDEQAAAHLGAQLTAHGIAHAQVVTGR